MDFPCAFTHHGAEYNVAPATAMDLLFLLLEAGVALALLLGIVWWTYPRARGKKNESEKSDR